MLNTNPNDNDLSHGLEKKENTKTVNSIEKENQIEKNNNNSENNSQTCVENTDGSSNDASTKAPTEKKVIKNFLF